MWCPCSRAPPCRSWWPWQVVAEGGGASEGRPRHCLIYYWAFTMTHEVGIVSLSQMGRWSSEKLGKLPRVTQRLCRETEIQAGQWDSKVFSSHWEAQREGSTGSEASKALPGWHGGERINTSLSQGTGVTLVHIQGPEEGGEFLIIVTKSHPSHRRLHPAGGIRTPFRISGLRFLGLHLQRRTLRYSS